MLKNKIEKILRSATDEIPTMKALTQLGSVAVDPLIIFLDDEDYMVRACKNRFERVRKLRKTCRDLSPIFKRK